MFYKSFGLRTNMLIALNKLIEIQSIKKRCVSYISRIPAWHTGRGQNTSLCLLAPPYLGLLGDALSYPNHSNS